ncbi:MAG: AAC(3) family N-acetyltransferase [Anaerolineales bacterium]|nr:AAC(3) family N-acetyltransferase [Anaerolineales bacterium]
MADVTFRDIQKGLQALGLTRDSRLLAVGDLAALGPVRGGAETVIGALAAGTALVVAPAFTPQCQVWPLVGPERNGARYADHAADNAAAEFFRPHTPTTGLGEALRHAPGAQRSTHPLYSFVAVGADAALTLAAQSLAEPLGPLAHLAQPGRGGELLLIGAEPSANLARHSAEARAGRKQFIRWALTPGGIVECVACPGCPDGFHAAAPLVRPLHRVTQIGAARVERLPLAELIDAAVALLRREPEALLCRRPGCERCADVRGLLTAQLA